MTEFSGTGANRAQLLTKSALRLLGLYPAARRVNGYLQHYRSNQATKKQEFPRHKNRLAFFRPLITANDLVFDIGAYYGYWTQVFLDLGATVVACEPQIDCLRKLRARQTARATKGRLTVVDCALGGAKGRGKFYVRESMGTSGLIEDWPGGLGRIEKVVDVGVVTLDDLIDRYGVPKYCKIDVEGYEQEVLKGLTKPIPMMSLEYYIPGGGIEKTVKCLSYLGNLGKLSLNVTAAESSLLLLKEWADYDYFVEFFTHHLKNLTAVGRFGDIFIRIDKREPNGA